MNSTWKYVWRSSSCLLFGHAVKHFSNKLSDRNDATHSEYHCGAVTGFQDNNIGSALVKRYVDWQR